MNIPQIDFIEAVPSAGALLDVLGWDDRWTADLDAAHDRYMHPDDYDDEDYDRD